MNEVSNDNTTYINALMLVQKDIIEQKLTEKQKFIVNYCICKDYSQKQVAKILGVSNSTVNKQLKSAMAKLKCEIALCGLAIKYYQKKIEEVSE